MHLQCRMSELHRSSPATDDMDKLGAVEFAEALLDATGDEANGVFRGGLWVPVGTG